MNFVDRVGAALVEPRRALAAADAGRGGMPDALLLVLLKIVCAETPLLVASLWSLVVLGPGVALSALLARLAGVIGTDLLLLTVGGVFVFALAGPRREASRDFDLGAVAWIPVLAVDTLATLVARVAGLELAGVARGVLLAVALAWMALVCVLGVGVARARQS
jgi:hypothetical protein